MSTVDKATLIGGAGLLALSSAFLFDPSAATVEYPLRLITSWVTNGQYPKKHDFDPVSGQVLKVYDEPDVVEPPKLKLAEIKKGFARIGALYFGLAAGAYLAQAD
ncbi:hypothetical protein BJ508DRAFT_303223 [Ascobolus immersus RN42]|uniref:Uncharacterized protein n=1 Tax=Ascobolus immersus RN42 TaxID=1160509 RepID=A0A3N4IH79_ASCIM|nr:hypothetical protein BJ508DRAFT_303223 [Ascobolus immersus RN42]